MEGVHQLGDPFQIGDRAVSTVCGCSSGGKMAAGVETAQYLLEKGNVHLKGCVSMSTY